MATKIPPPPFFSGPEWQSFNRWLLELTSILGDQGGIDPSEVTGLPAVILQVAANTANVVALETTTGNQGVQIVVLQGEITTLQGDAIGVNAQLTTLGARAQVLNGIVDPAPGIGNVNDWYANTAGAAGHRIFVKTGVATWAAFPF